MDIKKEIIEYVSTKEANGALLITGKWGCGKSYMLKGIVKELHTENEFAVVIISLFGIDSIAMLNERIKAEYLECNSSLLGKTALKAYKALGKVVKTSSSVVASAMPESAAAAAVSTGVSSVVSFNPLNFIAVKNTIGIKDKKRQFILIFDDFERCKINTIDLLGAINDYVENKEIKTILVADEDKISDNQEYVEFKEKLISRTLSLQPNATAIIDSIVGHYQESHKGYTDFLKANQETIYQVFFESQSSNFRSVKSFLIDFERIYATWTTTDVPQDSLSAVFYMFGAITFGVKNGTYKEGEYGFLFADKQLSGMHANWDSRHILLSARNWVVKGIWDENEFVKELYSKYPSETLTDDQKFLLYSFWDLEQHYITQGMPIAVQRAYTGDLTHDELIDLLQKVFIIKKYSIPLPCDVNYDAIASGFEKHKQRIFLGEIQDFKCHKFVEDDAIEETAKPVYKAIKSFEDEYMLFANKKKVKRYITGEESLSPYSFKGLPIGGLDRDLANLFLDAYYEAKNHLRREMIGALLNLEFTTHNTYVTAEHRTETVDTARYMIEKINQHTDMLNDCIATAINNNFVQQLQALIDKIDPAKEDE